MRIVLSISLILCFLSFGLNTSAQTLTYDVVKGSKTIGTMTVNKVESGNTITYDISSSTTFYVIKKYNLIVTTHVEFQDGMLINSSTNSKLNGDLRDYATVNWEASNYVIDVDGTISTLDFIKVHFCSTAMYHQEPLYESSIFSERFGKFMDIKAMANNKYEVHLPDGKKNYFQYEDGICKEVEVNLSLATIYFRLKN